ncbi:hypothetical protein SPRG_19053 [Saprolegnia parasitica CBS 223.65]|uniref:Uncharacterized protein n=1 Tax=Saprolegnia parasitica (strain CBS 223.65) TaxID=695850 RepID=A0A067CUQ7_SAPPC|nr:hypothetical protein SPRG_19053 [Saprolegnia parasitica CBS 223.65]KDO34213.1 hypothetical protein SPRG_19053 [Saprolegnia parasitica CBS 223.65]|eukprot:XP_012195249.1 hypothetical protein SPRG_19053 [Saprolegnia parasitica CBS 223.65]
MPVVPIELPLLYGSLWLALLSLWVVYCYRAKEYCTGLHTALGATAVAALLDMIVQLLVMCLEAPQAMANAFHAVFFGSFMLSVLLIAVGYGITTPSLGWRHSVSLSVYAIILAIFRWWRTVNESTEVLVLALTLHVLVLLYLLHERLPTDSVLPKYYLFRHVRQIVGFFFLAYLVFGAWTATTVDDSSMVFLILEESLILGTSAHLGLLLRPTPKFQSEDFGQWNAYQLFSTYARLMRGLSIDDVLSGDEILPLTAPRDVVVIQNPSSVSDHGVVVHNVSVGIPSLQ